MCESQSENNEDRKCCFVSVFAFRALHAVKNTLGHELQSVLLRILYLQNLHARLRSGRCLVGYPPNLCVQPVKVSLKGVNVRGTDSDRRGAPQRTLLAALYLLSQ